MFRSFAGFRANYHYLTLLVISEFNEWKVMAYGPGVTLHGQRQFAEPKAKEHAAVIARTYIHTVKHEQLPELPQIDWTPTAEEDWLAWRT